MLWILNWRTYNTKLFLSICPQFSLAAFWIENSKAYHIVLGENPNLYQGKPLPDVFHAAARRFNVNQFMNFVNLMTNLSTTSHIINPIYTVTPSWNSSAYLKHLSKISFKFSGRSFFFFFLLNFRNWRTIFLDLETGD